jgi:hypothetical protein
MGPMRLRTALAAVTATIAGGCGSSTASLSAECVRGASPLATALRSAPGIVELADGTRLSDCVRRADDDGEIQDVAAGATTVADRLAADGKTSETAAVQLGYLIGAARRGARQSQGIHAELVRRLESAAVSVPAGRRAALNRGLAAGERAG